VENYRPISLLSIVSKTLERFVLNHLSLRIQESVHSAQYGFISGRSSTSQLLSTLHNIGKDLDKGLQTDVVFMDISKAFDTVDHSILLQKLRDFDLSGSLLLLFGNYLSGRCQRVTVHGATSTPLPITSGVPQGSLLAPFLSSVYINDLPDNISTSIGVGLYADDTKLHRCVQNRSDALALQSDIQSLHCWSNENLLSFNKSNCNVLSITRRKSPFIYPHALSDHQLSSSESEVLM
jgi:retron-type reverse transcriptase